MKLDTRAGSNNEVFETWWAENAYIIRQFIAPDLIDVVKTQMHLCFLTGVNQGIDVLGKATETKLRNIHGINE